MDDPLQRPCLHCGSGDRFIPEYAYVFRSFLALMSAFILKEFFLALPELCLYAYLPSLAKRIILEMMLASQTNGKNGRYLIAS